MTKNILSFLMILSISTVCFAANQENERNRERVVKIDEHLSLIALLKDKGSKKVVIISSDSNPNIFESTIVSAILTLRKLQSAGVEDNELTLFEISRLLSNVSTEESDIDILLCCTADNKFSNDGTFAMGRNFKVNFPNGCCRQQDIDQTTDALKFFYNLKKYNQLPVEEQKIKE